MAKLTFNKLYLKSISQETKTVTFNEQNIEVKQYLPINDKLKLIADVLEAAADDNNFSNPVKLRVFMLLNIVFNYTNITFSDKHKEDLIKLYDIMESNGFFNIILSALPKKEYAIISRGIKECSEALYTYRNSIMGVLDVLGQDYSNLKFDVEDLQEKIADPQNLDLLKNIVTKLG